jgi:hypothetical protein
MHLTTAFLSFVATSLLIAKVDGAASINPTVFCSHIGPDSSVGAKFEVCATASFTSPSPATLGNGTTIYVGGYSSSYTIVKGLSEGEMFFGGSENKAGIVIDVVRDDSNVCVVSLSMKGNKTVCSKCRYCGDESFRADCSNVKYGRMMNMCESAGDDDVFFPLMATALPNVIIPLVKEPRRAPVNVPRRVPVTKPRENETVRAPVNVPRRAPVTEPRRAPIRAPIMEPRRAPVTAPRRAPIRTPRRSPVRAP